MACLICGEEYDNFVFHQTKCRIDHSTIYTLIDLIDMYRNIGHEIEALELERHLKFDRAIKRYYIEDHIVG